MQLEYGGRRYPAAAGDLVIGSGPDATLEVDGLGEPGVKIAFGEVVALFDLRDHGITRGSHTKVISPAVPVPRSVAYLMLS